MFIKKMSVRMLTVAGATALALGAVSGSQAATAVDDLDVSATVEAVCTITATALNFGTYDPVSVNAASNDDVATTLAVACTDGADAVVTLGQGTNANTGGGSTDAAPLRRLYDGVGEYLNYQLYSNAGRTLVWDNDTGVAYTGTGGSQNLDVYGRIPFGQNVPEGVYTDLVVATIEF
jgi:spore coat protein U-like protein